METMLLIFQVVVGVLCLEGVVFARLPVSRGCQLHVLWYGHEGLPTEGVLDSTNGSIMGGDMIASVFGEAAEMQRGPPTSASPRRPPTQQQPLQGSQERTTIFPAIVGQAIGCGQLLANGSY